MHHLTKPVPQALSDHMGQPGIGAAGHTTSDSPNGTKAKKHASLWSANHATHSRGEVPAPHAPRVLLEGTVLLTRANRHQRQKTRSTCTPAHSSGCPARTPRAHHVKNFPQSAVSVAIKKRLGLQTPQPHTSRKNTTKCCVDTALLRKGGNPQDTRGSWHIPPELDAPDSTYSHPRTVKFGGCSPPQMVCQVVRVRGFRTTKCCKCALHSKGVQLVDCAPRAVYRVC